MQLEANTFTAARSAEDRQVGFWTSLATTLADKVVVPAGHDGTGLTGSKDTHIVTDTDVTAWGLKTGGIATVSGSANDLSLQFQTFIAASEQTFTKAMFRIASSIAQLRAFETRDIRICRYLA
tara:strand:- start:60 stop:428 length:369 start_codon:yes stop_codon:yes gene_type:complete